MDDEMHRFDPVDALIDSVGPGLMRVLLGAAAIFGGYGLNVWANTQDDRSGLALSVVFTIFTWGEYGFGFLIGMLSLLSGLYLFYRFAVDEGGKLALFAIFSAFVVHYSPMTFPRTDWPGMRGKSVVAALFSDVGEPVEVHDWQRLLAGFVVVSLLYWLLPALIARILARMQKAGSTE